MPLSVTFGEDDSPHSPKGFLSTFLERDSHLLITSSFLYLSETSFKCPKNVEIISPSGIRSSLERLL
jgi:hypothetical protein